jgi:addiction module HigA family antidote
MQASWITAASAISASRRGSRNSGEIHGAARRPCSASARIVDILSGRRGVSPETALALARHFGNSALFWLNLQTAYVSIWRSPSKRGGGLARALIDETKRRSPDVVDLEVNVANPRARRFYEREGFVGVGVGASALSGLPTLRLRWRAEGK